MTGVNGRGIALTECTHESASGWLLLVRFLVYLIKGEKNSEEGWAPGQPRSGDVSRIGLGKNTWIRQNQFCHTFLSPVCPGHTKVHVQLDE